MKGTVRILLILALAFAAGSCELLRSLIHDDEVVASLSGRKLYRSDIEAVVPAGIPSADSTSQAQQYIRSWAMELLYADVASSQLPKSEQDVTSELEDYRRALMKFRYEQRYINERLDTTITDEQMTEYFQNHQDLFRLETPIVKARFLDIMKESPDLDLLRRLMSSSEEEDVAAADSVAYLSALRYEDRSSDWMDMTALARYFGTDYGTLLSRLSDGFITYDDDRGDIKIAYICDIVRTGAIAPFEYCQERIRDIIISARKRSLLSDLERDLLEDALEKENLIIY